jgi:hypothetical protein
MMENLAASGRTSMATNDPTGGALRTVRSRTRLLASIAIDSIFLAAWLLLLSGFDIATQDIASSADLEWQSAKWVLGGSTLSLILMYIYWDLRFAYNVLKKEFENSQTETGDDPADQAASSG